MDTNDINRRVRYALSLDDSHVLELFSLAQFSASDASVSAWRLKEGDEGFALCPPDALKAMLAGLIIQRRGPPESERPSHAGSHSTCEKTEAGSTPNKTSDLLDNNDLLKQLRIALSLKTDQVQELIVAGGGKLTKSEVNALFRKPGARNYRRCGDQVLRWFLNGLTSLREEK